MHGLIRRERKFVDGSTLAVDEANARESITSSMARIVKMYALAMSAYASILQEEQLGHLVAYIRSLSE